MNPVELRELMKDAEVRGQYLASIRHRGKDVLLGDIEKLIEIMIDEAVEIEERKTENAILNQQLSAKTISEQNIINAFGISGEGAHSKLVIEYVHGLVAENVALKAVFNPVDIPSEITDAFGDTAVIEHDSTGDNQGHSVSWSWVGNQEDVIKAILSAISLNHETPNTDAFTAELRAQGVDEFADHMQSEKPFWEPEDWAMMDLAAEEAYKFAANLRAGRKG